MSLGMELVAYLLSSLSHRNSNLILGRALVRIGLSLPLSPSPPLPLSLSLSLFLSKAHTHEQVCNFGYVMTASTNLQMGLIYGCAVEDIITGLAIICRGWKPVYFSPHKSTFLGVAPTTLDQSLIQDKRWSEGLFQILLSKYCPSLYGYGKVSSLWFLPFAYVFVAKNAYSILETVSCGETFKTLWNFERMWMMRSATSYLFAFIDNLIMLFGLSETTFVITAKVADEDVLKRYQHEIIEFGSSSLMFTIISTLALLNLFSSVGGIKKVIFDIEFRAAAGLIPHVILCGVTVMLHVPVYEALFVRNDEGQIPSSVMFKSIIVASLACLMPYLLYN